MVGMGTAGDPLRLPFFFKKDFIYLFLERGEGREKERERMCGCFLYNPCWEPGSQPRPVPRLGMEPVTPWFTGWCSIH